MWRYENGNTIVTILEDGTKTREYSEDPKIVRPESADVKITDYCDGGCAFCHERSTVNGKHCNFSDFRDIFTGDLFGMELAIGGGNPMSHPTLLKILHHCKKQGIIANITVNAKHYMKNSNKLKKYQDMGLLHGIGISYRDGYRYAVDQALQELKNVVVHLIVGVDDLDVIQSFKGHNVLLLGYKDFGFGKNFKEVQQTIDKEISFLRMKTHDLLMQGHISFDTLAIEQLGVQRFFSSKKWKTMFMGEEGAFSMYVDVVKKQFAVSSFSEERHKVIGNVVDCWNNLKKYENTK